jgi:outer membrane lipoprotein-sorting protein
MTAFATFARRLSVFASVACIAAALPAAEPAIVAKARAFVGSEATLNGVKSVHFVGTLVTNDPANGNKETRASMEIMFQKPEQQRIVMTSDATVEVTGLDGYEAWTRIHAANDPAKWRQVLLGSEQIKRLRANVWESLNFFRGIERVGGRVEEQGTQVIDGVTCQKVAFIHGPKIIFFRYFDSATGRLVLTETEGGGTIREKGEMTVDGIRFPKSIVTTTKNAKDQLVTVTIEFQKIALNEVFPAKLFAVPGISTR